MDDLTIAKVAVVGVVAFAAVLALGDYLGYKVGRWRLASYAGIAALVVIIAFAIYVIVFTP